MKHNDIRHMLSEYIDGAVTPKERATIESHLKTCTACSEALIELKKAIEHIKQVEEVASPAWLTQKIMAKVRAEAQEKKSIFERLFYPLAVKLPIQAMAVLFLAVTSYYIYQSVNPEEKYSETPASIAAKKEPPVTTAPMDEMKSKGDRPLSARQAPQAPGYKSLDMKYMYEKTPSPAPVPAKPAEELTAANLAAEKDERPAAHDKQALSMQQDTPSPARKQKTYSPSAGTSAYDELSRKAETLEKESTLMPSEQKKESDFRLSIAVKDTVIAKQEIRKAVEEVNGTVIESVPQTMVIVRINTSEWDTFIQKLRRAGEITILPSKPEVAGSVDIRIEIVKVPIQIR